MFLHNQQHKAFMLTTMPKTPTPRTPTPKTPTASENPIIVVGLDPGLANLGLGAVREAGKDAVYLDSALIRTSSKQAQDERLEQLYHAVGNFLKLHQPHMLAIEDQYFHQRGDIAFKVGQAFGVCLLAAKHHGVEVVSYGPMQVKQALVGSGKASKAQVAYMVRALLGLKKMPDSSHVADALALALTHLSSRRIGALG